MAATHLVVLKYGGTSVSTPERRALVASRIVARVSQGEKPVVVVSAMGRKGDPYATDTLIGLLHAIGGKVHAREMDLMMSCGEIISAATMAHLLTATGCRATALTGAQAGIMTEAAPGKARIVRIDPSRMLRELEEYSVAVVAGFQGITDSGVAADVTTLGRGGSDTTAVALAAALHADACYIYTDVDGVYTADPRVVPNARRVPRLSYQESLELCRYGAKVVHPRAVELGFTHAVRIWVGHYEGQGEGSWIVKEADMEISNRVTGVSGEKGLCLITAADVPNQAGVAEVMIKPLLDAHIEFKLLQSGSVIEKATMSYEVKPDDLESAMATLSHVTGVYPGVRVECRRNLGRVTVVGTGIGHPEYLWRVLQTLKEVGANNYQIENFEHRISCYIDEKDVEAATRALHDAFELGSVA